MKYLVSFRARTWYLHRWIINRTLHGRLEIQNFSSRVISTLEEKFRISASQCNILYIINTVNVEHCYYSFFSVGPFSRTRTIFRIAGTTERLWWGTGPGTCNNIIIVIIIWISLHNEILNFIEFRTFIINYIYFLFFYVRLSYFYFLEFVNE